MGNLLKGKSPLALIDQIIVSAANFASAIILVRALGLNDFGKYGIAFSILLYVNSVQMSFITSPMLTVGPLLNLELRDRFLRGMFSIQLMGSLGAGVLVLIVGGIARVYTAYYSIGSIIGFAGCVMTFQLQDWLRRYYFLIGRPKLAILCDVLSYVGQLVLLFAFWKMHGLSLALSFFAIAITSLGAFAMFPLAAWIAPAMTEVRSSWAECKSLSVDLLVANQVRWLGIQGIVIIGSGLVGTSAIGGLRATQNISGPINLAMLSVENVVPMRLGQELVRGGALRVHAVILSWIARSMILSVIIALPLAIFGKKILILLYGPPVAAFYVPMLLQLLNIVVSVAARFWFYLFRTLRSTRGILWANILCGVVSLLVIYPFGKLWGASGIVSASLAEQVTILICSIVYWHLHREGLAQKYPRPQIAQPGSFDMG